MDIKVRFEDVYDWMIRLALAVREASSLPNGQG